MNRDAFLRYHMSSMPERPFVWVTLNFLGVDIFRGLIVFHTREAWTMICLFGLIFTCCFLLNLKVIYMLSWWWKSWKSYAFMWHVFRTMKVPYPIKNLNPLRILSYPAMRMLSITVAPTAIPANSPTWVYIFNRKSINMQMGRRIELSFYFILFICACFSFTRETNSRQENLRSGIL